MDIEKPKKIFTEKHQIQVLEQILGRNDIGVIAKSILINKQIDVHFEENLVYEYLASLNAHDILYFMEDPEEPEKTIPPPKSASEWSQDDLIYYGIDIVKRDFIQMFGYLSPLVLGPNIEDFLTRHSDLFLGIYATEKIKPDFQDFSEFANLLDSYLKSMQVESRIDNLLRCFIHNILGDAFNVEIQVPFLLKVNSSNKCKAIVDVAVSYAKLETISQIIIVENKTTSNVSDNIEAQMIAAGIAGSQQKGWKEEWPLYMMTSTGLILKFYNCCFSTKFLNNVEKGYDCGFPTRVFQLITDIDIDLGKDVGRRLAAFILNRIAYECKKRAL